MLNYVYLLLLAGIAAGIAAFFLLRARRRDLREFAFAARRTLQLETCSGISPNNLYEYLLALAHALRMQATLRNLKLYPGEFEQVVTDVIETAYMLKRAQSNAAVARASLQLFATSLDSVMSKTLSGEPTVGNEGNFVGIACAVEMLANAGWQAESNADMVTCALMEVPLAEGVAEYWRTRDQAYRDRVERSFERAIRTALDPATASYVREKAFSPLQGPASTPDKN